MIFSLSVLVSCDDFSLKILDFSDLSLRFSSRSAMECLAVSSSALIFSASTWVSVSVE